MDTLLIGDDSTLLQVADAFTRDHEGLADVKTSEKLGAALKGYAIGDVGVKVPDWIPVIDAKIGGGIRAELKKQGEDAKTTDLYKPNFDTPGRKIRLYQGFPGILPPRSTTAPPRPSGRGASQRYLLHFDYTLNFDAKSYIS